MGGGGGGGGANYTIEELVTDEQIGFKLLFYITQFIISSLKEQKN